MRTISQGIVCLGIDPGIGRMGWGAVAENNSRLHPIAFGCLETAAGMPIQLRLLSLYEGIRKQLAACSPHFVSIEKLYFGRNTTTAEAVWQARGVAMLACAQAGLPILEPKPNEAKSAVCGDGNADKKQMQRMVTCLLGLEKTPKPDDTADALAMAITGLTMYRLQNLGRRTL